MIKNRWSNEDRCCLAVLSDDNRTVRIADLPEYPGCVVFKIRQRNNIFGDADWFHLQRLPIVRAFLVSNLGWNPGLFKAAYTGTWNVVLGVGDQQKSHVPSAPYCALEVVFP
jgi:hypothetical protein